MHASVVALEQAELLTTEWSSEPGVVLPLLITLITLAVYGLGVRALWSGKCRQGVRWWEATSFGAGCVVVAVALVSPLHDASERLFFAHMIQHELLMVVAAPLLVVGRPGVVLLWGLPPRTRQAIGRVVRGRRWRWVWRKVSQPFDAWLLHAIVIWGWHVPVLFQLGLGNELIHAVQHLSFVGSALLFWWAIVHPRRRADLGLSIIYLFTTAVHTAVLGALMTFARSPWYPDYAVGAAASGFTPLQDQQLAGLVMWIPASLVYLIAALLIVRRWLSDSEFAVVRDQRVTFAS